MRHWAQLVGINHYHDSQIPDLRYCVADASSLADLFLSHPGYGYSPDRLRLLTSPEGKNDQATRIQIIENLIELTSSTKDGDLLLFYFSGHGEVIEGQPYLIPSDAKVGHMLADTAIPLERIKEIMNSVGNASAKVIILDACYTGVVLKTKTLEQGEELFLKSVRDMLKDVQGIAVFTSSSRDEPSVEDSNKEHGAFTYYLLEAFRNNLANENKDAYLTLNEVFRYVGTKIARYYRQRPTLDFQGTGEIVLSLSNEILPASANPIQQVFPMAINQSHNFFGRDEELKKIKDILYSTADILIVVQGERCTGKTSLMNRTKIILEEELDVDRKFLYFSIDPSSLQTVGDFAREIWEGVRKLLVKTEIAVPNELSQAISFDIPRDVLDRLERLGSLLIDVTFVVFVDEFDKLVHEVEENELKKIISFLHYIIEKTKFPMLFFVSVLKDLPYPYGSRPPTRKVILHPFNQQDANFIVIKLLQNYVFPDEEILNTIFRYSGGNPFLIKLILYELFEISNFRTPEGEVVKDSLDQAIANALYNPDLYDLFIDIYYKHLDDSEKRLILYLASKDGFSVNESEIPKDDVGLRSALKKLISRDHILDLKHKNYQIRSALFGKWIGSWDQLDLEGERLKVPGLLEHHSPLDDKIQSQIGPKGVFIDLTSQKVYVDGAIITEELSELQNRALIFFAANKERIISKEELFNELYDNETYIGTDQSLDALIYRLRSALGDREKPSKYIETLRKRGFRVKNISLVRTK